MFRGFAAGLLQQFQRLVAVAQPQFGKGHGVHRVRIIRRGVQNSVCALLSLLDFRRIAAGEQQFGYQELGAGVFGIEIQRSGERPVRGNSVAPTQFGQRKLVMSLEILWVGLDGVAELQYGASVILLLQELLAALQIPEVFGRAAAPSQPEHSRQQDHSYADP